MVLVTIDDIVGGGPRTNSVCGMEPSRAPEQQVEGRVVTSRDPHRATVSLLGRQSIPALVARRVRLGNRSRASHFLASVRIEGEVPLFVIKVSRIFCNLRFARSCLEACEMVRTAQSVSEWGGLKPDAERQRCVGLAVCPKTNKPDDPTRSRHRPAAEDIEHNPGDKS